jgi:DHA3 family tetracycline resistance protein-like MFS transporter
MHLKRLDAFKTYLLLEGGASFCFALIFTTSMIYQVEQVNLNPLQLVLVGTLLELTVFLFEVPTGVVADTLSRRLSIILGVLMVGVGFTIEGAIPTFAAVLVAQLFWGLGATFMSGATQAWIVDEVGEGRSGQAFLRGAQAGQVAGLAGILGAVALGSLRINLPILAGAGLLIVLAGALALLMPENGFKPTPREERNTWQQAAHTFKGGLRLVRGHSILLMIMLISLIYGLYSEGFDRLWTAHLLRNFEFPAIGNLKPVVWFGAFSVAGQALTALTTEIVRRRVDTNNDPLVNRVLIVMNGLKVVGLVTLALGGSFALAAAGLLLHNVMRSALGPLFNTWQNKHIASEVRATVISMTSQMNAMGQIAGGPPVGAIGNAISLRLALSLSALILSPVVYLYYRVRRRERERAAAPLEVMAA